MHRIGELDRSGRARLSAALLLNALFVLATVLLVRVGYESNDDLTLAAFVDGQMAAPTAFIPYLNIVIGALLKGIYQILGQGAPWHTLGQYTLLFVSFTAMTAVLNGRLGILRGSLVSLVLLLFFAVDALTVINYTKTAAVCTVCGMLLTVQAAEDGGRRGALICGAALCLFGFLLRDMEALPCLAIMAALCLRRAWGLLFGKDGAEKGKRLVRFCLPFVGILLLCAAFWGVNKAAWSREPWADYARFDAVRVAYSDYGRPAYEEMPEAYEALGLSEADVKLLEEGNYFDPEVFSGETMQAISEARDARFPARSWGECLGEFLDRCLPGFFINYGIYGLLLLLALWLCGGKHEFRDFLALGFAALVFLVCYLYLIRRGRYLVDRVDMGLFFAAAAVCAYLLDRERLGRERLLSVLLALLALGTSFFLTRPAFRSADAEDFSGERAAVETLLADTEHVYLAKLDTVSDRIYTPFETAGKGYWDRIVLLGGFDCNHPTILDNLRLYGVENPYRDCIGNERVYLIEDDVELTLRYLREHYDPTAEAEPVEPLSTQTGLRIYRIVRGGAA
ncbi:MAG: hypothetical protein K6F56_08030 [Oscillospiraceae bacterium]|nr:hypothetical protein [Oscillospiraceae bacterium]